MWAAARTGSVLACGGYWQYGIAAPAILLARLECGLSAWPGVAVGKSGRASEAGGLARRTRGASGALAVGGAVGNDDLEGSTSSVVIEELERAPVRGDQLVGDGQAEARSTTAL